MDTTTERWCIYAGPLLMIVFCLGFWVVGGLVPPPSPHDSAQQIATFYAEHATRIRIGLMISMLGAGLTFPFSVAIFMQMRRIEGGIGPMSVTQLVTGLMNGPLFILPMVALGAATFRAGATDPSATESLHDLGWLAFVGIPAPAVVQLTAIAIAGFRDRSENPVFARWFAYFNVWCALAFIPGILVICFQTGPFAWNGIIAFWIPLSVFGAWWFVTAWVLLKGLKTHEEATATAVSGSVSPAASA
jgi:hypothetical protein